MSVFVPIPCCFDYHGFVVLSEVLWGCYASSFALSFQEFFRNSGSFMVSYKFHINFRITCSSSVKNVMGNLIGITVNL